jgi:hypothetical protein
VAERVREVLAEGGAIEETRLKGNLLSSHPLCFNPFSHLRTYPEHETTALLATFDLEIETIEVEWVPYSALVEWSAAFHKRYLDLPPVLGAGA